MLLGVAVYARGVGPCLRHDPSPPSPYYFLTKEINLSRSDWDRKPRSHVTQDTANRHLCRALLRIYRKFRSR